MSAPFGPSPSSFMTPPPGGRHSASDDQSHHVCFEGSDTTRRDLSVEGDRYLKSSNKCCTHRSKRGQLLKAPRRFELSEKSFAWLFKETSNIFLLVVKKRPKKRSECKFYCNNSMTNGRLGDYVWSPMKITSTDCVEDLHLCPSRNYYIIGNCID